MVLLGRGEKGRFLRIPKEMSERQNMASILLLWGTGFTGNIALSLHKALDLRFLFRLRT